MGPPPPPGSMGSMGSMGSIGSKGGGSREGPPACAMTCERPPASCEDFMSNFVGPAGCAESCSDDTKKDGFREFCGEGGSKGSRGGGSKGSMGSIGSKGGGSKEGPPACAMTCSREPDSCEDFMSNFVGPAGCAESCSEDTKKEGF